MKWKKPHATSEGSARWAGRSAGGGSDTAAEGWSQRGAKGAKTETQKSEWVAEATELGHRGGGRTLAPVGA